MRRYGSIYVATNTLTGEQYVGQTNQKYYTRVYAHKISAMKPTTKFHRAVAAAGYDAFVFEEVFHAFDRDALNWAEQQLIADYAPVYNVTRGGAGSPGPKTAATRAKLAVRAKERWADPAYRERVIPAIRAGVQTPEAKENTRKARAARPRKEPTVYGPEYTVRGKPRVSPEETRAKQVAAWNDPVKRAARIASLTRAQNTPEAKARSRANMAGRTMSPDTIKRIAESKHKPIWCRELDVYFESQKHAAEQLGVSKALVSHVIARKGRVMGDLTLERVS